LTQFVATGDIDADDRDSLPILAALVSQRVAQLDGAVSRQLNYILHHEDFQALEASWRGSELLGDEHRDKQQLKDPCSERDL
jgi:type VI secretion system protein ImpC